jgi:putative alpha-1,2-mannosidase
MLDRVNVVDSGATSAAQTKHLSVFYTGLWRALTFPRRLDETDKDGNMVHYSPYSGDGGVHPGPLLTDNGFWDTFRTGACSAGVLITRNFVNSLSTLSTYL